MIFASNHARILLKGKDAKSFLHRLSTNAVETCKPGESCLNVLVNQKGRMVELLHQIVLDQDQVLIFVSPGRASEIIEWLDQFLFVEKVEMIDCSKQGSVLWAIGTNPISPSPERHVLPSFQFLDTPGHLVPSWLVYDGQLDPDSFKSELKGTPFLDESTFSCARIASGIPLYPNEINEAFNPLELGLTDALHWAKGCYIGQEVISRLQTYQKSSRKLVKVYADADAFPYLKSGQALIQDGQKIGRLTSVAPHHSVSQANALAIVKSISEDEKHVCHVESGPKIFYLTH